MLFLDDTGMDRCLVPFLPTQYPKQNPSKMSNIELANTVATDEPMAIIIRLLFDIVVDEHVEISERQYHRDSHHNLNSPKSIYLKH